MRRTEDRLIADVDRDAVAVVFATSHRCLLELSMNLPEVFAVLGEGPCHVKALVCTVTSDGWTFAAVSYKSQQAKHNRQ